MGFGAGTPKTPQQAVRFETPGSPEYEAAVAKGLDMSQAGRIGRAKEMAFDTDTVLYHQTKKENTPSIMREGFDLSRVGARGTDDTMPDGVFLKSNDQDIGVGASGADADQLPVFVKRSNLFEVKDREALKSFLQTDPEYRKLQAEADKIDIRIAREYDEASDRLGPNDKLESLDAILEKGQKELEKASSAARARATEILKQKGYDGIVMRNDKGGMFGRRQVETTVIFDPSNIRSVNAAFDPEKSGSSTLLAAAPFAAVGGVGAGTAMGEDD
jgi:hypothetical protein